MVQKPVSMYLALLEARDQAETEGNVEFRVYGMVPPMRLP